MKILKSLPRQLRICTAYIGKKCLQPGIHRILHLLPEGTVHVGLHHAILQGPHTHLIDRLHPFCGGRNL